MTLLDAETTAALPEVLPATDRPAGPRQRLVLRCATPSSTPSSVRTPCSHLRRGRPSRPRTPTTASVRRSAGRSGTSSRSQPTRSRPSPACTRWPSGCVAGAPPGGSLQLRRVADPGRRCRRRRPAARLAGLAGLAARRRASSTSSCAGGSCCGWPSRRRRRRPARRRAGRGDHRGVAGRAREGRWPRCRTPRRRPGRGSGSPATVEVPNYELEAIGLGTLAGRPGAAHRPVRRPVLRRGARHHRGPQQPDAGRGDRHLLPALVGDRGRRSPGRTPCSAATTSTRRSAARWSTRPGTWSAASRSARRSADDRAGRPAAPTRTDGADPRHRAPRGRAVRAQARGPAGHRGAPRDPRGLARLPRPARLGDDAHARPRLRAGGRVQLPRGRSRLPRRSAGSPTAPTSTSPRSRSSTS